MTKQDALEKLELEQEALEKLELEAGASQQEIKQQYREFYNEFKMRITNAPTTRQKTLYQRKLKQLEEAYNVLTNENAESLDSEIPWTSPGESTFETNKEKQPEAFKDKITKVKALELLNLKQPFTNTALDKAFNTKKTACEKGKQEALNDVVKQAYIVALQEVVAAYQILIPFAKEEKATPPSPKQTPPPKQENPKKGKPKIAKPKKDKNALVYLIPVVLIVAIALFIWKPWESKIEETDIERYTILKASADTAVKTDSLSIALTHYQAAQKYMIDLDNKKAIKLLEKDNIKDSISSISDRIDVLIKQAIEEENNAWYNAKSKNTIVAYNLYLEYYPEGAYKVESKKSILELKKKMISPRLLRNQVTSSIIKSIENNSDIRIKMQLFLTLELKLIMYKLINALYEGETNFKIENKIYNLLNQKVNGEYVFLERRKRYENNKLSRYRLASILPYIKNDINQRISENSAFDLESYIISESDLFITTVLAEGEIKLRSTGLYDSRFISNERDLRSIINILMRINDALANSSKSPEAIKRDIKKGLKEINNEIVELIKSTKLNNQALGLLNDNIISNGNNKLIKDEFKQILNDAVEKAQGFLRSRFLRYSHATINDI